MTESTVAPDQNEALTAEELSTPVENINDGSAPENPIPDGSYGTPQDDAAPVDAGPRPIQFGDEGEEVEEVQFLLGTWGKLHEHYQTGKFCATTRDAVKAFQQGQVYPATGEVDEATLAALRGERDRAEAVLEVTAEEDQPAA